MRLVPAIFLLAAAAGTAGPDRWETGIVDGVRHGREAAGRPALTRDPILDRIARERARLMASKPEGERFNLETSVFDDLEAAGVRRYLAADERRFTLGGYDDVGAAVIEQWRRHATGWAEALDPKWNRIGAGIAPITGGSWAAVAVLLQGAPVFDPAVLERRAHDQVNIERGRRGLALLAWSSGLAAVARAHSVDMARRGFFDHRNPDGRGAEARLNSAGFTWTAMAENIAKNLRVEDPAAAAVAGWMKSRGHRENILDPNLTEAGMGVAIAADGTVFFTQDFLRPRAAGAP